ncbi:MAG: aldo/keto reductase [Acidimicrobiales bacterium]|jgi:aryl-alcohol dehydrogenase-like predicted oxidoreductase
MDHRTLGVAGPVSAIGLGCMGMSGAYGPTDRADAIATVHAALDAGITLVDTGDFYGMGHNELLVGEAIGNRREDAVLSVKFGAQRGPDGSWQGFDARPSAVKTSLAYSLQRLGTDYVDVYRPARLDPAVPIEDTVGAIAECIEAGWVRHLGLSEVGADTIRRAQSVHPVADVQIEYSLMSRGPESAILPTTRELGIAITAYGVLSRGLLSGSWSTRREFAPGDFRAHAPRFAPGNVDANLALVEALAEVATAIGAPVAEVAMAWVLARGEDVVPVIGARTPAQLEGALRAVALELDDAQLAAIEAAVPNDAVAGTRYAAPQMAGLDSERPPSAGGDRADRAPGDRRG